MKAIDAKLRVGGPSTSNFVPDARFDGETEDVSQHKVVLEAAELDTLDWQPVWMRDFLAYCEKEKLPVDFVSCHPYPTDWALDEHNKSLITDDMKAKVEAAKADIVAGKVEVHDYMSDNACPN